MSLLTVAAGPHNRTGARADHSDGTGPHPHLRRGGGLARQLVRRGLRAPGPIVVGEVIPRRVLQFLCLAGFHLVPGGVANLLSFGGHCQHNHVVGAVLFAQLLGHCFNVAWCGRDEDDVELLAGFFGCFF